MRALGRKRAVVQEESRPGTLNIAHVLFAMPCSAFSHLQFQVVDCRRPAKASAWQRTLRSPFSDFPFTVGNGQ
eukprot:2697190-Pyramimonas_sp.AAC.1